MSQLCQDSFTDTAGTLLENHTGAVGATWTKNSAFSTGSAAITAGNRCRGNATNGVYYESGVPASADYDVEADLYAASNVGSVGILGRSSTTAATYYFIIYQSTGSWLLASYVNGSIAQSVSFAQTLTVGQTYHVHLVMRGTTILGYINGVLRLQMTDSNITAAGRAGVFFSEADTDTTGYHLVNFSGATPASDAVTDTNVFFSPYNWKSDGAGAMQSNNVNGSSTYALTNNPGAYVKFTLNAVSQGSVTVLLDTTPLNGVAAASCPTLDITVDGQAFTSPLLAYATGTTRILLADNLSAGNHTFEVFFKSVDLSNSSSMGDRWNGAPPQAVVKITGLELDGKGSATISSGTVAAKRMIWFADSFAEGAADLSTGYGNTNNDATQSMPLLVAQALGAEVGVVGFATQGFGKAGYGNVPMLYNATDASQSWNKYYAGQSRLAAGLFAPAPDYIVVMEGTNDTNFGVSDATVTTAVQSLISAWRAAAPTARIFVCVPPNGDKRSAISTGVTNAADSKTTLIDLGTAPQNTLATGGLNTNDGIHPSVRGHASFAAGFASLMQTALGGTSGSFAASTGNFIGGEVLLTDGAFAV